MALSVSSAVSYTHLKIADETPQKRALVWCNVEGEEHIFSFADIKKYSNQMANVFQSAGTVSYTHLDVYKRQR